MEFLSSPNWSAENITTTTKATRAKIWQGCETTMRVKGKNEHKMQNSNGGITLALNVFYFGSNEILLTTAVFFLFIYTSILVYFFCCVESFGHSRTFENMRIHRNLQRRILLTLSKLWTAFPWFGLFALSPYLFHFFSLSLSHLYGFIDLQLELVKLYEFVYAFSFIPDQF